VHHLSKPSVPSLQALAAAITYVDAGLAVFPVRADKTPLTPHGLKNATRDLASIAAWWRLHPYADIGWAIPATVVVIDIDRKAGQDGYRDFERLTNIPVDAFETPQATTPSGGRHLVCKTDRARYRNGVRVADTGIDVRATGGYVVLPSPGNGRAWVKPLGVPLLKPPAWIPTETDLLIDPPRPTQRSPATPSPIQAYRGDSPYGLATLRRVCADISSAPHGLQEITLNSGAYKVGRLIGSSELAASAEEAVLTAGLSMPSYDKGRPWRATEVETKVRRAVKQGIRRPYDPGKDWR
jgi:putative DNA primase/helicase